MIRSIAIVAFALALSACTSVTTQKSIGLVGGEIIAQAPDGYCIDSTSSNPDKGFAIVAPCFAMGAPDSAPSATAVATIQIGETGSGMVTGAETQMRSFLQSDEGAALLSATGDSTTISDFSSQVADGTVTVRFNDSAPPSKIGLQQSEWRVFTDVNGRLVTIALRGPANAPLTQGTGNWLLNAIAAGVKPATVQSSEL
ncbi:hypothetical protein [Loktanella sp. S4079]|uniref:hypothetical protein n=1 Tax=Loktanella sp. S4079 TaxID=579483 RepID=UPI000697DDB7|nr:hypothetical protein [Loktanella sp. S4079]